ncbi:aldehyde dehydrogenase family protein [Urbifossiella limnaea]|uniref:Succinate-semialdehyde dehydrogenase [NADP(+)] 2 n=1 Tax=Urbifossiella limnaea TaxID=2528023 RepID=A0A517XLA5_9BACT|nr:aldehyde dehydrogenase family protein [Urbifossiella limnaea]QDU18288.1 Putative succinate-semialdehyde dehydrogenase [NADP(+)] 2 [Urbifossiella limnaea]
MPPPPFAAEAAACRAAQVAWAALPVRERLHAVAALRKLVVARVDALVAAAKEDVGRTRVDVIGTELLPTGAALKFLERSAVRTLAPRRVGRRPLWLFGCRDTVHRRPWGVVGVIGTWNYPIYLNVGPIAQALVAGNGVLWKPSELAPRTADVTARLFADAGFPAGLLTTLPATREAGPQLADADVDYVLFTGSDGVGRKLAARLGERLIPSTLELSGVDAMFVLADADVKLAARAAWFGLTLNRGQTCLAVRRVFVHRSRLAEFLAVLEPLLRAAGPAALVTPGQAALHARLVADGVERGATALGGDGASPTLLLNAAPDAAVCREAAFSPVGAVLPFDDVDTAVSQAAASPFGLGASVFSADTRAAEELAARIPAGSVTVNDVIAPTAHPETPFGGRGASGWGVTQGPEGLLALTVPQVVTVRRGTFRPHADEAVAPDPEATADVLHGLLRATYGGEWWGGLRQLLRGVRRKRK